MLALLTKKQFYESFKGIFIDAKNGKKKPKSKIVGMIILFVFIFLSLGFSFFGMSMLASPLIGTELVWVYYSLFGVIAVVLGVFVDAFSASAYLFRAKDNNLLLSMPIKPRDILTSRIIVLYALAVVYSGMCWLPICLNVWINGASLFVIVFDILLLFVLGFFITALSCVIGYIFALIASKAKNKALISVLSTILIIGVYYYTSFKMQSSFENFVANADQAANNIKNYISLFYLLGKAADGSFVNFIIFTLISLAVFGIVYYVLTKRFIKIATTSDSNAKVSKVVKYEKQTSAKSALLKRELKRFVNTPAYLINCGLGAVFAIAFAVFAIIKANDVVVLYDLLNSINPALTSFVPIIIIAAIGLVLSMDVISTPSFSLEGKNLWILKSLPLNTYDIFEAKERLHLLINGIPGILSAVIVCLCLKLDISSILYVVVCILLFVEANALFGLIIGILRPNFNWTNEAQPVKQSLNVLLSMLFGLVLIVAFGLIYYLLFDKITFDNYMLYTTVVMIIMIVYMRRWIRFKGVKVFENL